MRLVSLRLKNYRRFKDAQIEFPDGVIGIIGLNGSGKSSIVEAIAWTLFGNIAARTEKEQIKSTSASNTAQVETVLELELGGNACQVVRTLKGAGQIGEASIIVNGQPVATAVREVEKEINYLLGMDYRSFYTSFYAKQKELNALTDLAPAQRKETIIRMLRINAIDKAIELIREDIRSFKNKSEISRQGLPDKNILLSRKLSQEKELKIINSEIKPLQDNFDKLTLQKQACREAYYLQKEKYEKYNGLTLRDTRCQENIKNKESELKRIKTELESISSAEAASQKIKPEIDNLEMLEKEERQLENAKHFASRLNNLELKKKKCNEFLHDIKGKEKKISEQKQLEKEAEEVNREIKEIHGQIESVNTRLKDINGRISKHKQTFDKIKDLEKCPTCGQALAGSYKHQVEQHFSEEALELNRQIKNLSEKQDNLIPFEKELESKLDEKIRLINDLRLELGGLTERQKRADSLKREIEEDENELAEVKGITYNAQRHLDLKDSLRDKKVTYEEYIKLKAKASRKNEFSLNLQTEEKELEQLIASRKEIEEERCKLDFNKAFYESTTKDFEKINQAVEEFKDRLHRLEITQTTLVKDLERLEGDLKEYDQKQNEINALLKDQEKGSKVEKIMLNFREELIARIQPELSTMAGSLFAALTEGKYRGLELDENYDLLVLDGGEKYSIARYSGGETDLANLCLRLAISQLISKRSGSDFSFIILDEIFGSQDIIRKNCIMSALTRLAKQFRQILLITHVEDIKDSLEHIIEVREDESGISRVIQ